MTTTSRAVAALCLATVLTSARDASAQTHALGHRALAAAGTHRTAAPRPPCLAPAVEIRRAHDDHIVWRGALTDCTGHPALHALAALSVLASPAHLDTLPALAPFASEIRRIAPAVNWSLADETTPAHRPPPACPPGREPVTASSPVAPSRVPAAPSLASAPAAPLLASAPRLRASTVRPVRVRAPQCRAITVPYDRHTHDPLVEFEHRVRVIHPRLVAMLAQVAAHFAGHRVEVISGYRPSRDPDAGSRHAHARALDFRMTGVSREALRDYVRTLPDAGVGYYPNSVFVHMDVRDRDEGPARWTDYAGPGEHARYGHWPPRETDVRRELAYAVDEAQQALAAAERDEATAEHDPFAATQDSATAAANEPATGRGNDGAGD